MVCTINIRELFVDISYVAMSRSCGCWFSAIKNAMLCFVKKSKSLCFLELAICTESFIASLLGYLILPTRIF